LACNFCQLSSDYKNSFTDSATNLQKNVATENSATPRTCSLKLLLVFWQQFLVLMLYKAMRQNMWWDLSLTITLLITENSPENLPVKKN